MRQTSRAPVAVAPMGETRLRHRRELFVIQRRWRTTLSRHRLPLLSALVCLTALLAGPALADRIPSSIKSSNTPSEAVIQTFIDSQVKDLNSDNQIAQKQARDQLINEATSHSGTKESPEYATAYANTLAKALPKVLNAPSLRTRLDAAVVAAGVATAATRSEGSASGLQAVVIALLKDKQVAVALWGAKAAKYVIASDLKNNIDASGVASAVLDCVKNHDGSGPLVEEAFNSLTLEGGFTNLEQDPAFQKNVPSVIPSILKLIAMRADQYKNGGSLPSPLADRPVTVFIPVTAFQAVNSDPKGLKEALTTFGDATCAIIHSSANGNSSPDTLDMIKAYGTAFDTFGQQMSNPAIQAAGKAIEQISQNTDPTKMSKLCDDLAAALKTVGVNIANNGPGAGANGPQPVLAQY